MENNDTKEPFIISELGKYKSAGGLLITIVSLGSNASYLSYSRSKRYNYVAGYFGDKPADIAVPLEYWSIFGYHLGGNIRSNLAIDSDNDIVDYWEHPAKPSLSEQGKKALDACRAAMASGIENHHKSAELFMAQKKLNAIEKFCEAQRDIGSRQLQGYMAIGKADDVAAMSRSGRESMANELLEFIRGGGNAKKTN